MGTTGRMLEQSGADCPTTRAVNELPGASGVAQVPVRPVLIKEITYSRTPLSRTTKIQRICPGQREIRDSGGRFGVNKFRSQGFSYGTARDPGQRVPGQRGVTVYHTAPV